jgi:hypothetical protein
MAVHYPQVTDANLGQMLHNNQSDVNISGWIYGLEVGREGSTSRQMLVPALTVSWSWRGEIPNIQVILALLVAGATAETGLDVTAYRFETPDMLGAEEMPDHHHAQPTARRVKHEDYLGGVRRPLNEVVPRFPLDVTGPVGIVMSVLVALYGRKKFAEMLSQDESLGYYVRPHLTEMPIFYDSCFSGPERVGASQGAQIRSSTINAPSPSHGDGKSTAVRSGRRTKGGK